MQDEIRSLRSAHHKEEAHKSNASTRYQHFLSPVLALLLFAQFFPATAQAEAAYWASAPAPRQTWCWLSSPTGLCPTSSGLSSSARSARS